MARCPVSYREGAEALGIPAGWTLRKIVLKAATPGIITGLLIAIAIAVGETAPLLAVAGWNDQNPALQLTNSPVGYLTYPIFNFYQSTDPVLGRPVLRRGVPAADLRAADHHRGPDHHLAFPAQHGVTARPC